MVVESLITQPFCMLFSMDQQEWKLVLTGYWCIVNPKLIQMVTPLCLSLLFSFMVLQFLAVYDVRLPIKLLMAELFPCQLRSILVLNLSVLRKNSFWEYFMRINWEKFVEPSIFHTKFRSMALHEIWLLWFPKNFWSFNFGGKRFMVFAGDGSYIFQKVLPEVVSHGTSPQGYHVRCGIGLLV